MRNRQEYQKAYRQAHKEQHKAQMKAWYEAHKESEKAKQKAYYKSHTEEHKARVKAWKEAHKEECKAYDKAWREAHKEQYNAYRNAYTKSDLNSLGQTKHSIRMKSQYILKKMNLKIPGYQIHHCFTYDDASKFIYISKALHRKIHKYLKEHNIDADTDHWFQIRDIVNSTYEFVYIKC